MYVIEVSGSGTETDIGKTASNVVLVPAERCTFTSTYNETNKQYEVVVTQFYTNGNKAPAANLNFRLGYVGKSGRFVPISGDGS